MAPSEKFKLKIFSADSAVIYQLLLNQSLKLRKLVTVKFVKKVQKSVSIFKYGAELIANFYNVGRDKARLTLI